MIRSTLWTWLPVAALVATASPVQAQWSQVAEVPPIRMFAVTVQGDTIAAAADTSIFLSTDGGTTWRGSTRPAANVAIIDAVRMHDHRLYAGTFGRGVFVSDDLGATWQDFNQGLVGGFADSQLDVSDLQILDGRLFAATLGAGVYVRDLSAGGWSHFGEEFEPNQSSDVNSLALGGARLFAAAGANGTALFRNPGDSDWTLTELGNTRLLPGFTTESAIFTGTSWVVGTSSALFRSTTGVEPWTRIDLGIGGLSQSWFAAVGTDLFGAFDVNPPTAIIARSGDDGATWEMLDVQPGVFVFQLAAHGTDLYAARGDGLWRRPAGTTAVPHADAAPRLRVALLASPVHDVARFRIELPAATIATLEIFDLAGRRLAALERAWPAGAHEWDWTTRDLAPGVYAARVRSTSGEAAVRVVRLR